MELQRQLPQELPEGASAAEILAAVEVAGITVTLTGEDLDRLVARPTELVTPPVLALLRERKHDILAELRFRYDPEKYPRLLPPLTATKRELARADNLGLVATWSKAYGYVAVHDPTTGEWHDIPLQAAPHWAKAEAFKRKHLWRVLRDRKAYTYTSREMEKKFREEEVPMWVDRPLLSRKGILWEDYRTEEDEHEEQVAAARAVERKEEEGEK